MTQYVVRHLTTRCFWTGKFDGWSPNEADARRFEFMTDANLTAYNELATELSFWVVEPVAAIDVECRR